MESRDEKHRESAWDRAANVLAAALAATQSDAGRISLGYQVAVLELIRGEWWRQHGELHPDHPHALPRARRSLASAIRRLKEQDLALFPILRHGRQMKRPTPASIQALELEPLAGAITYRLGLAELALARCLEEKDPNRRDLLRSALAHLEPMARGAQHTTAFQASIESQAAARLMGDFAAADAILDRWMREKTSSEEADILVAERADWLLDQGKSSDALELLETTMKTRASPPPRWSYIYIKALLRAAGEEKEAQRIADLHALAFRQLRVLEDGGDTPWLLRGEILLREQAANLSSTDSANVRRAAEILAKSGEFTQAADLFRDAAAKAERNARADEVVSLLAESGRVLESAGRHGDAAAIFVDLAKRQPDHPQAPTHLLRAVKNLWRGDDGQEGDRGIERIQSLLADHQRLYPDDATAPEARYLLAAVRRSERRFAEAIELFASVPSEHRLGMEARLRASRCHEAWLAPLADDIGPNNSPEDYRRAIEFHEHLLRPEDAGPKASDAIPQPLSLEARQELSIRLAKFLLDSRADRAPEAKKLLDEVLASETLAPGKLIEARRYRLFAAVSQGDAAANRMIEKLGPAPLSVDDLLATLALLEHAAEFASSSKQRYLGELQDRLLSEHVHRAEIPPSRQRDIEHMRAAIDVNVGTPDRVDEAIRRLRRLRQDQPPDARTLLTLGKAFLHARRYESAIETFRQLIAEQRTGSREWYRGKLYLVRSLRLSGQFSQAKMVFDQLEILHPDLGGPRLKPPFLQEKRILEARR